MTPSVAVHGVVTLMVRMSEMAPGASVPQKKAARCRPTWAPLDFALYAGAVLAWGFSWIALSSQVSAVAPEVSVVWRFALAAPLMMAIALARSESLRFPKTDHLRFAALGATIFSTNFTLFYYGAQVLTSGLLSVVFSLASIINVGLGALVLGAPIDRRVALGALFGGAGVALMFYPEIASAGFDKNAAMGLVYCLAGTLSFCFGNMISAGLQRRAIPVFAASAWGMLYGAILLAFFAAFRGRAFVIEPTPVYIGGLVFLAVVASVGAFAFYLTLLGRIGADRAAYATVMIPIVALGVSTVAEAYVWTWPAALGLLAVITGNVLVLKPRRQHVIP